MSYPENSYSPFRTQSGAPLCPGLRRGGPFCCSTQWPSLQPGGRNTSAKLSSLALAPPVTIGHLCLPSNTPSPSFPVSPQKVSSVWSCARLSGSLMAFVSCLVYCGGRAGRSPQLSPQLLSACSDVPEATAPSPVLPARAAPCPAVLCALVWLPAPCHSSAPKWGR